MENFKKSVENWFVDVAMRSSLGAHDREFPILEHAVMVKVGIKTDVASLVPHLGSRRLGQYLCRTRFTGSKAFQSHQRMPPAGAGPPRSVPAPTAGCDKPTVNARSASSTQRSISSKLLCLEKALQLTSKTGVPDDSTLTLCYRGTELQKRVARKVSMEPAASLRSTGALAPTNAALI